MKCVTGLAWLGLLSLVIGFQVYYFLYLPQQLERQTRQNNPAEVCITAYQGIELNYTRESATTFTFDLCRVIKCHGQNSLWRGYDLYLCAQPYVHTRCAQGRLVYEQWCPSWAWVIKYTGPHWTPDADKYWENVTFSRLAGGGTTETNPVQLTLKHLPRGPFSLRGTGEGQDTVYLILGVEQSGGDTMGMIKINILDPVRRPDNSTTEPILIHQMTGIHSVDYSQLSTADVIMLATGGVGQNLWLGWLTATAKENHMADCVACSVGRPTLYSEPAPLLPQSDKPGFRCMIELLSGMESRNCSRLSKIFPPISNYTRPPPFKPGPHRLICFSRSVSTSATRAVGMIEAVVGLGYVD